MRAPVLLLCLLAFSAAAAGKKPKTKAPPPPPPALTAPSEKLGEAMGGKVAEMLVAATKFEIARTSYSQGIRPAADKAIGSDFQRESAWKELAKGDVEKLHAIVYDEKAFRLGANVSGCNFVPDVVFQLTSSSLDTQQMLVSFKCTQVLFFTVKTGGRAIPGMALDFKPSRKKMLELVKALLPQDSALQGLK
jgi:hypothetical protein